MNNSKNLPSLPPELQWLHGLVRCNPFYLLSAVLLVYGIYRISIDPGFFATETRQLLFSFGALQTYCALLVATTFLLASRKIWYDSALLVFIQHFLVLIPFMLVSQAAFLSPGLGWGFCLAGLGLACAEYAGLRRFIPKINLPGELMLAGFFVLLANSAIPLVFRKGLDTSNELWAERSLYCWYLWLPLLVLLGQVMPKPVRSEAPLEQHQKEWIPVATYLIWIAATCTHVLTVGYVDEQKFRPTQLGPVLWAASWFLISKGLPLLARANRHHEKALFIPAAASLLALPTGMPELFFAISLFNALVFFVIHLRNPQSSRAPILANASLVVSLFGIPRGWIAPAFPDYHPMYLVVGLGCLAGLMFAVRNHNPKAGLLGALTVAILAGAVSLETRLAAHIGLQAGIVFYLLHSLSWNTSERGSTTSIVMMLSLWALDTLYISGLAIKYASAITPAGTVVFLTGMLAARTLFQKDAPWLILASLVVLLTPSGAEASKVVQHISTGMLALLSSFALFGAGTAWALIKPKFATNRIGNGID